MPTEEKTLKPCPFCGSEPNSCLRQSTGEDGSVYYSYHEIACENRECGMMPLVSVNLEEQDGDNPWEQAVEKAIDAWNRRLNPPQPTNEGAPASGETGEGAISERAIDAARWEFSVAADWIPGRDRPKPLGFHVEQAIRDALEEQQDSLAASRAEVEKLTAELQTTKENSEFNWQTARKYIQGDHDELAALRSDLERMTKERDQWAKQATEHYAVAYPPCPECGCEERRESDMTLTCECPSDMGEHRDARRYRAMRKDGAFFGLTGGDFDNKIDQIYNLK